MGPVALARICSAKFDPVNMAVVQRQRVEIRVREAWLLLRTVASSAHANRMPGCRVGCHADLDDRSGRRRSWRTAATPSPLTHRPKHFCATCGEPATGVGNGAAVTSRSGPRSLACRRSSTGNESDRSGSMEPPLVLCGGRLTLSRSSSRHGNGVPAPLRESESGAWRRSGGPQGCVRHPAALSALGAGRISTPSGASNVNMSEGTC